MSNEIFTAKAYSHKKSRIAVVIFKMDWFIIMDAQVLEGSCLPGSGSAATLWLLTGQGCVSTSATIIPLHAPRASYFAAIDSLGTST